MAHPEVTTPDHDFADRILARCVERGGCLEWTGGKVATGYGHAFVRGIGPRAKRYALTHRVVFAAKVRPLVHGEFVCHRCDNPPCCNPAHLFAGDSAINNGDAKRKGRTCRGERNGDAKLTEAAVKSMRHKASTGATVRDLSAEFGVCMSEVRNVIKRRTWKHI